MSTSASPAPLHRAGSTGNDAFLYRTAAEFLAPGRTADGGAGVDSIHLQFDATLADADFAGLSQVEQLILAGHGAQSVQLGPQAGTAFGPMITLYATAAGSLAVDGSGLGSHTALTVYAGAGQAVLTGGAGDDGFVFDSFAGFTAAGRAVDGGFGADTLTLGYAATGASALTDAQFAGLSRLESLHLGTGQQEVTLGANAAAAFGRAMTLYGNKAAALHLDASGYEAGARLVAYGSAGADDLTGGPGNDIFTGNAGADVFRMGKGGQDIIKDFHHGEDVIDLTGTGFASFEALIAAARQVGRDAVISLGGQDSLTIANMRVGDLAAADVILAAAPQGSPEPQPPEPQPPGPQAPGLAGAVFTLASESPAIGEVDGFNAAFQVNDGVEYRSGLLDIDVSDRQVILTVTGEAEIPGASFRGYDLDFGSAGGSPATGFTLAESTVPGLDAARIGFADQHLHLNLAGLHLEPGMRVVLDADLAPLL